MKKENKQKVKKNLAFILAIIMFCASAFGNFAGNVVRAVDANVPSNVTFESLGNTLGVHSISANLTTSAATRVNLGEVSSQTTGFQCRVTNPGSIEVTNDTKRLAIGLYNASSKDPWNAGYLLYIFHESENKISWEVRHNNGKVIGLSGTISDISDEEIIVYAWLNGKDSAGSPQLNVVINDIQIATDYTPLDANSTHVVTTGNYVSASNTLCDTVVFKHVAAGIPANVTFESLANTLGVHSVSGQNNTRADLGQVSSQATGFQCRVTNPGSIEVTNDTKRLAIGLYNASSKDPWNAGYLLYIFHESENKIRWEVRHRNGAVIGLSGTISDISGEEIMVYAWLNGVDSAGSPQLNVIINDIQIATDYTPLDANSTHVVTTGNYVSASNTLCDTVVLRNVTVDEPPTDVTFEDLGQTIKANIVDATSRVSTNLGQVTNESAGFKCLIPNPSSVERGGENRYYLGLYTSKVDPWAGFTLRIANVSADTFNWDLLNGNTVITNGQIRGVLDDKVMLYAWQNGKDADGNALLNVILGGQHIIVDATTTRETGQYVCVYNAFAETIWFETVTKIASSQVPTDVTFEDLVQTAAVNNKKAEHNQFVSLGALCKGNNGFVLRVTNPSKVTPYGTESYYEIGLYNTVGGTAKGSTQTGGFVLRIWRISADIMMYELCDNQNNGTHNVLASGKLIGVTGDVLIIHAWLSGTNAINVLLNDQFLADNVTYDLSKIDCGLYMNGYNGMSQTPIVYKTYFSGVSVSEKAVFVGYKVTSGENAGKLYQTKGHIPEGAIAEAVYVSFYMEKGASVRLKEGAGIRWKTNILAEEYNELIALGAKFGTRITSTGSDKYIDLKMEQGLNEWNGVYYYIASLVNIKEANYTREYQARGYADITYADGSVERIYAAKETKDQNLRIYKNVVTMAYHDVNDTKSGIYENKVSQNGGAVYSPYTSGQYRFLEELLERITDGTGSETDMLIENRRSAYKIVLPENPTDMLTLAAEELQYFMKEATGVTLKIVSDSEVTDSDLVISLGRTQVADRLGVKTNETDQLGTSGYVMKTIDKNIVILDAPTGDGEGVLYGVYDFLYDAIKLKIYASDEIVYNNADNVVLYGYSGEPVKPTFDVRSLSFYELRKDHTYAQRMRLFDMYNNKEWGLFGHTQLRILPFNTYGAEHEDWYNKVYNYDSLGDLGGTKVSGTQLCYSAGNEMVTQFANNLIEIIKAKPNATYFMLGHMDNQDKCVCSACKIARNTYGESGLQVRFLNAVIEKVEELGGEEVKNRELKYVFYAYQISQDPPKSVAMDDKLYVFFTPVGANFADALPGTQNTDVYNDLQGWNEVAPSRVLVYTYSFNYRNFLVNFNNFDSVQEHLQTYKENDIYFMYSQGPIGYPIPTFSELRIYVESQLMWDAYTKTYDELATEFMNSYYGVGATAMLDYYEYIQDVVYKDDQSYGGISSYLYKLYNLGHIQQMDIYINQALTAVQLAYDDGEIDYERYVTLSSRIKKEEITNLWLKLNYFNEQYTEGELEQFALEFYYLVDKWGIIKWREANGDIGDMFYEYIEF